MATTTDPVVLPPNKTYGWRRSSFVPASAAGAEVLIGVVEVREARKEGLTEYVSRYALRFEGADGRRRVYRLTKPGGLESHFVSIVPGGSRPNAAPADLCDCDGFAGHGTCKHTQALAAHLSAGHLG